MMNPTEYQTVILAAFFRLFGKHLPDTSFSDCFPSFHRVAEASLLQTLVQKKDEIITDLNIKALSSLVDCACSLAITEKTPIISETGKVKEVPLASVLQRINRVGQETTLQYRYHLAPLTTSAELNIFPEAFTSFSVSEWQEHLGRFNREFKKLCNDTIAKTGNFDVAIAHLVNLAYKYFWCIPADMQSEFPDISLYDGLKISAAIASCLYKYHSDNASMNEIQIQPTSENRFLLVLGDVSGIQKYIFDITRHIGVGGGVARRLRARSLYVQLCSDVAAHAILQKLDLPISLHIIMNTGGNFYLLLPNLSQVKDTIAKVQKEIDEWFLKELNGELALNLAYTELNDENFGISEGNKKGFSDAIQRVRSALESKKLNRFHSCLVDEDKWVTDKPDKFVLPTTFTGEKVCVSCHKFPQAVGELCHHCARDKDTGAKLPDAQYLAFYTDEVKSGLPILNHWVIIASDAEMASNPYLVVRLNNTELAPITAYPAASKYLAKYIPVKDTCDICQGEEGNIATFECIAGRSQGDNLLGFLKADVDNLGRTLIFGLKSESQAVDTIARVSTLSRMLDTFFCGWMEKICSENKNIYTVFSGGDDLFLIGPWNDIVELTVKIRSRFIEYTRNETLSISAGILFGEHSLPIASASDSANEILKMAKDTGRNRIALLGIDRSWDDWTKIYAEWNYLVPRMRDITSAFLHNLLTFSSMWQSYQSDKKNTRGLRYHPLLAYNVARNLDRNKQRDFYNWTQQILDIKPGDNTQSFLLDNLGIITRLLIFSRRGGKNDQSNA